MTDLSENKLKQDLRSLKLGQISIFRCNYAFDIEDSVVYLLNHNNSKILQTLRTGSKPFATIKELVVSKVKASGWAKLMELKSFTVKKIYDPEKPLISGEEDVLYSFLNTYKTPKYLKSWAGPQDITRYHTFMDKLFPSKESRQVVEKWIWQSLSGKARTHLLLVGAKGTGKTFLASTIMSALHGASNHYIESATTLKSNFDSFDADNTLIFLDEATFPTEELKSKIKYRLNTWAAFNHKYRRVTETLKCLSLIHI